MQVLIIQNNNGVLFPIMQSLIIREIIQFHSYHARQVQIKSTRIRQNVSFWIFLKLYLLLFR